MSRKNRPGNQKSTPESPSPIAILIYSDKTPDTDSGEAFELLLLDINGKNPEENNSKILSSEGRLLPSLEGEYQGYLLMPSAALSAGFNFSELTKRIDEFPGPSQYKRVLFKDQPFHGSGIVFLGKELYQYLSGLPAGNSNSPANDLEWYLERMNINPSFLTLEQRYAGLPGKGIRKAFSFHPPKIRRSIHWNVNLSLKEFKSTSSWSFRKENPIFRFVFLITALVILLLIPAISFNAAISGDEEKHHMHAEKVYNYFKSGGEDTLALHDPQYKLNYYGQSFDLFAYLFIKAFNIEKVYETRHIFNGITGALAIIFTGLMVRLLAGNFGGFLAMLFLAFSPRFLGHAMNNPLDMPFAMGYIFTIYQIFRFLRKLPEFSFNHALYIALGIAWTTSIRIGGLVLIPYLLMFSGLFVIFTSWPWPAFSKQYLRFAGKGMVFIAGISIAGFFISLLPWPYALEAPLKNPFKAFEMMADISVALRVMFEGEVIWSDNLPWYYLPKNILITVPIIVLSLFVFNILISWEKRKEIRPLWILLLYFTAIFPVAYVIYRDSNIYGGWRHLLFVYPSMAALAAITASWLKNLSGKIIIRTVIIVLILAAFAGPLAHSFRNYPLQYIYFNQLAGGIDKAYKKYETDYYMNSLKPASEWLIVNEIKDSENREEKLRIISNAPHLIMSYYFRDHEEEVTLPYTRYYDRGQHDWDYAVFFCNYIDPFHIRNRIWPPKNTIHEIKVDDVVVGAVVKRENRNDYLGHTLIDEARRNSDMETFQRGIEHLRAAIEYDPHNEVAHLDLATAYIILRDFGNARKVLNTLLEFYPRYDKAVNLIGYSYLNEGQMQNNVQLVDRAILYFNETLGINYKFVQAYHYLGLSYMLKEKNDMALQQLNKALEYNAGYKPAYYLIADIFRQNGDEERARQIIEYANSF